MPNLDSVLTTLNSNTETNTAIHSSQFDSVGRNGHLLAALPCQNKKYGNFVSISSLAGKCTAHKLKKTFALIFYGHVYIIQLYGHINKPK